jgi:hypothetical protein
MAGVKPASYLLGVGGVMVLFSLATSAAFGFIGSFSGMDWLIFVAAMMSGIVASIVLGLTIGIIAGNQQNAAGLSMPVAVIVGFGPVLAQFNDSLGRVFFPVYTRQLDLVATYLNGGYGTTPLWQSFAIMWANVAVLAVIFAIVYKKKGLTG